MSTRGVVGVGNQEKWTGVYNHWDSYPSELGQDVWNEIQSKSAEKLAQELLTYGDWREYLNHGVCEFCGKKVGQPHSYTCNLEANYQTDIEKQNVIKTGYPDPQSKHHSHSNSYPEFNQDNSDPLFIEWIYLINLNDQVLEIYKNKVESYDNPVLDSPVNLGNGRVNYGHCECYHIKVGVFPFIGKEPDWESL